MGTKNKGWANDYEKAHIIKQIKNGITKKQIASELGRSMSFVKRTIRGAGLSKEVEFIDSPPYSSKHMDIIARRLKYVGECWICKKNEVMIGGTFYTLSRVLYSWHKELDLYGLVIVNDCGQKNCVNPKHHHTERHI